MEVLLLELIVSSGLHIATTSKRKDMWNQINRDIFHNALFLTFKDEHFKEGDYRKLRDKFTLLKKESSKLMDDGNKSKYGGELSPKFKLLNQIIAEESAAEIDNSNKKSADDEERKLIQETGDRVVAGKVSKRDIGKVVAHLDGSVSDNRIPKKANSFEEYLMRKMENDNPADTEGEVGKRLSGWVSSNGKVVQDLFIDINLSMIPTAELRKELEVSMTLIEALGLKSLINIYCQNGKKFHADYFRERMMSTSIHVFVIYKIFPVLEAWREDCCKNSFVTPPTSGLGYQSTNSSGSTNDLFSRQSPALSSGNCDVSVTEKENVHVFI